MSYKLRALIEETGCLKARVFELLKQDFKKAHLEAAYGCLLQAEWRLKAEAGVWLRNEGVKVAEAYDPGLDEHYKSEK